MSRTLTDYEKFVNTEALLACQRPIEGLVNSHELFFQVTHQAMELWMKVIGYELRVAIAEMDRPGGGDLPEATLRLHRVPSNVTTRVRQLEERLGTQLFTRHNRKLVLSAEGKVLLRYADEMLRLSHDHLVTVTVISWAAQRPPSCARARTT